MDSVVRHLAYNKKIENGVLCSKPVKEMSCLERKVIYTPIYIDYGLIKESVSNENITPYFISPAVRLVPCAECLKHMKIKKRVSPHL